MARAGDRVALVAFVASALFAGGNALAVAGITMMTNAPVSHGSVPWFAILATLGSVLCAAQGCVLVRAFRPVHLGDHERRGDGDRRGLARAVGDSGAAVRC